MMRRSSAFTIVELLIVIVVIAILAAITIVAYNGIQQRSRDSRRSSDFTALTKALSMYKIDNGGFPASAPNPGVNTFEYSRDPGFMSSLNAYTSSKVFSDPKNSNYTYSYQYHTFNAGLRGCPASMGPFYVLWTRGMESQSAPKIITNGCDGQDLFSVTPLAGAYTLTNGDYAIFGFN